MDSKGRNVIVCDNGTGVSATFDELFVFFQVRRIRAWPFAGCAGNRRVAIRECGVEIRWNGSTQGDLLFSWKN